MAAIRVLLYFADASTHILEETAGHVVAGKLYVNPPVMFAEVPVTLLALQTAIQNFADATGAQKQGGTAATAAKDVARDALVGLLRQDALFVQGVVQKITDPAEALAALLSTGFDAVSTSRAQHPLAAPNVGDIKNVGTGRLQLAIRPVPNARLYEVQFKTGTGEWASAGMYTNSRKLIVTGLTPGTMYTFQVRAVGGSTGQSDWSNPVSHMSL